ncbi:ubiquitin-conjugating enzyme/RWD-like protein [Lineolata rhizophorae]|uniref:Ubiquitin-conjugating enzyme E2 2 n=1 Tax=Lineolata rhizophorae TaxID=578093 RepID=A0A6A6NZA7_9PEZI|nr:ubiquitin-conjugating enzyme/RWD-like protein [Lineolata rhizophorae]
MAERILMNEYKMLAKEPWTNIEVPAAAGPLVAFGKIEANLVEDNIFEWSVALIPTNKDSFYQGGYYKAIMTFPKNYPYSPPDFKFLRPLYHPNVYPDGRLCISILHAPGEDEMSGELAAERWSPAQRVESVLISILSLLDDAEVGSPANVDAGVLLRKDRDAYRARVAADVETSKQDIPLGFVMPEADAQFKPGNAKGNNDDDFNMAWDDSDADEDLDFGGSDSDVDFEADDMDEDDVMQETDSEEDKE